MTEPILDPGYWRRRLQNANELHHSIYMCPLEEWVATEQDHIQTLRTEIEQGDSILDLGCGYGRLLSMLPFTWKGDYLGVDISPDLIRLARETYPTHRFLVMEFVAFLKQCLPKTYDKAVLISIKGMVIANLGGAYWETVETELKRVCGRIIILEYT